MCNHHHFIFRKQTTVQQRKSLRSKGLTSNRMGMKVPGNEKSCEQKFPRMKDP